MARQWPGSRLPEHSDRVSAPPCRPTLTCFLVTAGIFIVAAIDMASGQVAEASTAELVDNPLNRSANDFWQVWQLIEERKGSVR